MDPYEALGVTKTASAEEIKSAHRKIVKESHPDLNPGDAAGEERFKADCAVGSVRKGLAFPFNVLRIVRRNDNIQCSVGKGFDKRQTVIFTAQRWR